MHEKGMNLILKKGSLVRKKQKEQKKIVTLGQMTFYTVIWPFLGSFSSCWVSVVLKKPS